MLSARGALYAWPRQNVASQCLRRTLACKASLTPVRQLPAPRYQSRSLTTTHRTLHEAEAVAPAPQISDSTNSIDDIEQTVRDAKQRFRDTLPRDYLSEEEYTLYVRLYGPPLRETVPQDVGIDTHADMAQSPPRSAREGTILKELEGGEFEEITYEIPPEGHGEEESLQEGELAEEELTEHEMQTLEQAPANTSMEELQELLPDDQQRPNYIQAVARNQREADALQRLADDFERSRKEADQESAAAAAAAEKERREVEVKEDKAVESAESQSWPAEYEEEEVGVLPWEEELAQEQEDPDENYQRFHPYTVEGSFHGKSTEVTVPREELVLPVSDMLRRTHIDHVRTAAERSLGGAGLPLSSETLASHRNGHMGGVGLLATQRHMTEIEADAFMAGFMPGVYASTSAILREVRKRVGPQWLRSKLREGGGGGVSVLDAGSGGAGLIAWNQILRAEWELLKEEGSVGEHTEPPQGRKTVICGSDRLRSRLKELLDDTTFLPRMPDYEHSGEMRGPRLDGGGQQPQRKSFDIIIASHMLLREKESHRRQAILNNLWHLLKKDGGVLVIQEKGHPRGFEAVAHARHTMINSFMLPPSGEPRVAAEDFNATFHREPEPGQILAPCTTQGTCPMYVEPGKSNGRRDFCRFSQRFVRPAFNTKLLRKQSDNHGEVEFSYVAVQRGVSRPRSIPSGREATEAAHRGYEKSDTPPDMQTLPRMVLPTLKRKGHVTMDMCTPEGRIERWTVPKSFSKAAYHDARKSRWGDLWALGAKTRVERDVRHGQTDEMAKRQAGRSKKGRRSIAESLGDGPDGAAPQKKHKGPKSKKQKEVEMIMEIRRAEEEEVAEIEEEMAQEVEGDDRQRR